jgi:hypothetical protein
MSFDIGLDTPYHFLLELFQSRIEVRFTWFISVKFTKMFVVKVSQRIWFNLYRSGFIFPFLCNQIKNFCKKRFIDNRDGFVVDKQMPDVKFDELVGTSCNFVHPKNGIFNFG